MTLDQLLSTLRERRVRLWSEDGALRYEAPADALDEELLAAMRRRKPEILAYLQRAVSLSADHGVIRRRSRDGELQLPSFGQQRLWFVDRLQPGATGYCICQAWRLHGALDEDALRRAVATVSERHEVLRSAFREVDGEPFVVVDPAARLELRVVELTEANEARRLAAARRAVTEEVRRPFDLARWPLVRPTLLRFEDRDHVLVLAMHHIVTDGWSISVLMGEISRLYEAYSLGRTQPLPELPIQYADYADWQRERLSGGALDRQLAFWREHLAGVEPLELPVDRTRPAMPSYAADSCVLTLPAELRDTLEALGRGEGATLFMTLLAAVVLLLNRAGGSDDVVVGAPVANRHRRELEPLIGFFVNILVLRVPIDRGESFRGLLGRLRATTLDAYDHQDLPFERLVAALELPPDLSRNPLFQVTFSLINVPDRSLALHGLEASRISTRELTTRFDLEIDCPRVTAEGELDIRMIYSTDLFERTTIRRLIGHYRQQLEGIVGDPDRCVAELPLMSDAQRCQLLVEWNDTAAPSAAEICLHSLFDLQARRVPDRIAVVCGHRHLSYGELDRRSDLLAGTLREVGVAAGDRVALCVDRGPEMVAGLLAILRAGAAYVPLDPALPAERLEFLLADSGCSTLVTELRLGETPIVDALCRRDDVKAVYLDALPGRGFEPADGLPVAVTGDHLAYVIYTSGSTGRPKGVEITHRSVVSFLTSMAREPGLSARDVLLAVTTLSFDIATLELFGPLAAGGRVVIAPRSTTSDGGRLAELHAAERITVMQATPATWQLLLQAGWRGDSELKMLCGGEALPHALATELRGCGRELWNLYGPTEATVWATGIWLSGEDSVVPIGRPIGNMQTYVLDPRLRPVPCGTLGELYLGGAGLARGYRRRSRLTAEHFVPNPFAVAGCRLYRTGDLVRLDARGRLLFLGRADTQVKLRGFRIELGEIEGLLERHPTVKRAVVMLLGETVGERRLVAFLSAPGGETSAAALRGYLSEALPEYMVPAAFVPLPALPLSASGKIDRKALDRAVSSGEIQVAELTAVAAGAGQVTAPRGPVEEAVAGAFAEVLEVREVAAGTGFFDLGGHSLLATQLLSRIRDIFRLDLPLSTVFAHRTVRDLAARIEEARRGRAASRVSPIAQVVREGGVPQQPGPLSAAQRRLWFLDRLGAGPAYNMKFAIELEGELEVDALVASLRHIVRRHEVLRATFPAAGGKPRQVVSGQIRLPFATVDLAALGRARRSRALDRFARILERQRFDLARGPLLRAILARLGPRRHVLLVLVHHIAFDGWSAGIFRRELAAHYQAASGRRSSLPELEIQYLDFAAWQQERLQGPVLEHDLAYWKEQLGSAGAASPRKGANGRGLPVVQLPTDRPRPLVQSYRGGLWRFRSALETRDRLSALSRRQGVTLAMLLLAAFKVLLARVTGQRDLIVGSPIAQRLRSEVENLIGFFANTIVLRTDLSGPGGGPAFMECLRRVQQVSLAAYDHQEMPFDLLVDEIDAERDLGRNPIFQIVFAFQHIASQTVELPGLRLRPHRLGTWVARMDLELFLMDDPDGLAGALVYNTDLFDATTVGRIAGQFQNLLGSLLVDPGAGMGDLAVLGKSDRHQLTAEWSGIASCPRMGRAEGPLAAACLHDLIAAWARAAPDRVAVICDRHAGPGAGSGPSQLSYGGLETRADRIAHSLRALGVGADDRVALCLERGVETIVALLGIWQAGGAYVPLDPDYPAQRLDFMLRDSRARVLVTRESLLAGLPEHGAKVLCLDRDAQPSAAGQVVPEARQRSVTPAVTADNLAYMIYTSGSTGRPKGVLVPHRGLRNLAAAQIEAFGVDAGSRVLQFASLSFDASVSEVAMALAAGAAIVVAERPSLVPGPELVALMRRCAVTTVTFPPTALAALPDDPLPALETMVSAGEACSADLVRRWGRARRLVNAYGPTEVTVCATLGACDPRDRRAPAIGRPMAGACVYLLDGRLRRVPAGVAGELHVAGPGVARGYGDQPVLSAERFLPDPFAEHPGARMYRTGDLARYRGDGALEYLGRVDQQMKVRGYRIESGEIEAVLRATPGVRGAVVVAEEVDPGRFPRRRPGGVESAGLSQQLVAYLVTEPEAAASSARLRRALRDQLPEFMIPSRFVPVPAIPLTPNGKVDRDALRTLVAEPPAAGDRSALHVAPRNQVEARIVAIWGEVLGVDQVGVDDNFFDLGGHSLLLVQVQARLHEELGCELSMTDLFQYPTVVAIAERLAGGATPAPLIKAAGTRAVWPGRGQTEPRSAVAVIALAGRFPGAADVEALWSNVESGVESIRFFTDEELLAAGVSAATLRDPSYVKARGMLGDARLFDARLFGYTPREAELIDPQQRIFLECAWQALERAGYDPQRFDGLIGVYAGASSNGYLDNVRSHPELVDGAEMQAVLSNGKDYLPTRVSYKLNLRGPSLNIQTACSTSLVAVHTACRALLDQQCDVALAGGVSIGVPAARGYRYREGGIGSPDGHCRTFDARAQGTLRGDGAGIVVLKRLDDALVDGDHVHAVILGSAINNDGSNKVGFTAPGIEGQAEVIAMAQAAAGVDPESISYVEAHGTATPLGDPIEVAALTRVFRERTDRIGFCGLSALKSNVGHLDATAGVAGLIKAVLALEHRTLPPSLHFERANPEIDFDNSPFYVVTERRDWQAEEGMPRRAGVSSFGLGGTNAHAVLEQAPALEPSAPSRGWQLLVLSAQNQEALDAMAANLAEHLRAQPPANLADVAYTLQVGRRELGWRRMVRCRDLEEAIAALAGDRWQLTCERRVATPAPPVTFMFPGQGAQDVDMGVELYAQPGAYRAAVDACLAIIDQELGLGLQPVLYPEGPLSGEQGDRLRARLERTSMAQPALFTVCYALARQWMAWGIEPESMIGHSIGETVAACLAGVLSLEDALRLVVARGRLMAAMPPGAMTAVPLDASRVETLLTGAAGDGLWLSVVNAPSMCVVSGTPERVAAFESRLAGDGAECRRLRTSHAFHSGLMDGAIEPFVAQVRGVEIGAPKIPYLSGVTGDWILEAEVRNPGYWGRQIRCPVRFAEGMERILADPSRVLLEVGPGTTLKGLSKRQEGFGRDRAAVSSLGRAGSGESAEGAMAGALGRLWTAGVAVDWARVHAGARRRRVTLPTYPFQRQRYWIERRRDGAGAAVSDRRADLADWFYAPVWRRSSTAGGAGAGARDTARSILVIGGDSAFGRRLVAGLEKSGRRVTTVDAGASFKRADHRFTIDPRSGEDYLRLLAELGSARHPPGDLVHLWGVSFDSQRPSAAAAARIQERGLDSLMHLARALEEARITDSVRITVVTDGVHQVLGDEAICPEKATVLGACRIIPLEFPGVRCRNIDLTAEAAGELDPIGHLVREILEPGGDAMVAYRRGRRWTQTLAPIRLGAVAGTRPRRLRRRGVYLITGGLGGIGLEIATELARALEARLVLTGRTGLPERGEWARHSAQPGADDRTRRAIQAIEAMEAAGAEVLVAGADVCDPQAMRAVVTAAEERFGAIDGVFHLAADYAPGIIQRAGFADVERELAPKVTGTRVLEQVLAGREIDFLFLASSLITWFGLPGRVAYCAANAYLDAFAHRFGSDTGIYAVAANWTTWSDTGLALRSAKADGQTTRGGITSAEGIEVLRRLLDRCAEPQILVSEVDPRDLGKLSPAGTGAAGTDPVRPAAEAAPEHGRPPLSTELAPARDQTERRLLGVWQDLLGIGGLGILDNYYELGGDSVLAIRIVAVAREAGIAFTVADLLQHQTVATLAAASSTATALDVEQGAISGPLPLTPGQCWFFEQGLADPHHNNQAVLLEMAQPVEPKLLAAALDAMLRHHDALRLRFACAGEEWRAEIASPGDPISLEIIDLADTPPEQLAAVIDGHGSRIQSSLDFAGPIIRAALLRAGDGRPDRLLLVVHHLAVDVLSWQILLEDLARGLRPQGAGRSQELPHKTTSIRAWAEHLAEMAQSADVAAAARAWCEMPWARVEALPRDFPTGDNTIASIARVSTSLDAERTRALLRDVTARLDARIDDILLAALAQAVGAWSGAAGVAIDVEGLGRDSDEQEVDVSRTVGWFTAIYPVLVEVEPAADMPALLARTQQRFAWCRRQQLSYSLARYLSPDAARARQLRSLPPAEISFVYFGRVDPAAANAGVFKRSHQSVGPVRSPRAHRRHLLEIDSVVSDGSLHLGCVYGHSVHDEETIRGLIEAFKANLERLIQVVELEPARPFADPERFGWSEQDQAGVLDEIERLRE